MCFDPSIWVSWNGGTPSHHPFLRGSSLTKTQAFYGGSPLMESPWNPSISSDPRGVRLGSWLHPRQDPTSFGRTFSTGDMGVSIARAAPQKMGWFSFGRKSPPPKMGGWRGVALWRNLHMNDLTIHQFLGVLQPHMYESVFANYSNPHVAG